jgi:hypothetical protein
MRRPQLLIGLFVLATILADVVAVAFRPEMHEAGWSGALLWALYLSQVSLMAMWLGLGQTAAPLRIVAAFFVLIEWNVAVFFVTGESRDLYAGTMLTGMITAVAAIPLIVSRLFGLRLARLHNGSLQELGPSGPERFQFSLLFMFGLMTTLAIVLGLLQYTFIYDHLLRDAYGPAAALMPASLHAVIAWAAVWLVLGRGLLVLGRGLWGRATWMAALVLAALCAGAGLVYYTYRCRTASYDYDYFSSWRPPPPHHGIAYYAYYYGFTYANGATTGTFVTRLAVAVTLLFASLLVFRVAGYRVVFRRGGTAAEPEAGVEKSAGGGG